MKKNLKSLTAVALTLISFMCLPSLAMAQGGCPDPLIPCPIDGGLTFLIAAGVGYGIKKVRDSRKEKQEYTEEAK